MAVEALRLALETASGLSPGDRLTHEALTRLFTDDDSALPEREREDRADVGSGEVNGIGGYMELKDVKSVSTALQASC